jgi:two-component system OmpR family sensor kinase
MTIRRRLTLWYAALIIGIIVLFATTTYGLMRFVLIQDIDRGLVDTANLITRNSAVYPSPTFGAPARLNIELALLDALRAPGIYVQAWEVSGDQYLFRASSTSSDVLQGQALDQRALDTEVKTIRFNEVSGVPLRVLTQPLISGNSGQVSGLLQIGVRLDQLNHASDKLLIVMIGMCAIAGIGAVIVSLWFSQRALQPIESITEAASRIAHTNDLQTRLEWDGPNDELGRLTSVFNHMMGRIERLFSVQKHFVADISHELRTPLTAIQGHCELVRRYGADEQSLEAIEEEVVRMSRLVGDLLMLARADYGGVNFDKYPLDFHRVVVDTVEQCRPLAEERGLKLDVRYCDAMRVRGDEDRLRQMIFNLLKNAVKFTPEGGQIVVGLENINDQAVLWVKDTGIGISDEDKARVFDRFFQSDFSRNHDDGEGFGLGLTIVKWIAERHEGTVNVSSRLGEGSVFTVVLPIYHEDDEELTMMSPQTDRLRAIRARVPLIRREVVETVTKE